jgi:hypothetical protein
LADTLPAVMRLRLMRDRCFLMRCCLQPHPNSWGGML